MTRPKFQFRDLVALARPVARTTGAGTVRVPREVRRVVEQQIEILTNVKWFEIPYQLGQSKKAIRVAGASGSVDLTENYRMFDGQFPGYSSVGGYPIAYVTDRSEVLCSACTNELDCGSELDYATGRVILAECNWENDQLHCDECEERIESAYAEDCFGGVCDEDCPTCR